MSVTAPSTAPAESLRAWCDDEPPVSDVALFDITAQGATTLASVPIERQLASTDERERGYWTARIRLVNQQRDALNPSSRTRDISASNRQRTTSTAASPSQRFSSDYSGRRSPDEAPALRSSTAFAPAPGYAITSTASAGSTALPPRSDSRASRPTSRSGDPYGARFAERESGRPIRDVQPASAALHYRSPHHLGWGSTCGKELTHAVLASSASDWNGQQVLQDSGVTSRRSMFSAAAGRMLPGQCRRRRAVRA
jgi:hypothetical protein